MRTSFSVAAACVIASAIVGSAPARAAGPVTVVTLIDVIPDVFVPKNEEAAHVVLKKMNADSQSEPGLVSFTVRRETVHGNHFALYEIWKSEADLATHLAVPHTRQFRKDLQPLIGSPYDPLVTTAGD